MTGRVPSVTARTLVARSRRPAPPAGAAPALRLAEPTVLAPPQGGPAPAATASAPAWQTPTTTGPAVQARAPQAAVRQAAAPQAAVPPPAVQTPISSAAPAPAGVSLRYPDAVARAATASRATGSSLAGSALPSAGAAVPAAPLAPARATGSAPPGPPPVPVVRAARPADATGLPRHDGPVPQAPAEARDIQGRAWPGEPVGLTPATGANQLVARARRPGRSVSPGRSVKRPDDGVGRPAAPRLPGPVTAEPPAPERSPARAEPLTGPRAAPTHPPVTIGEIHVHVAEPPSAAADPLALLAPYARGLTARQDGDW
jgi:hypothetical protein